MRVGEMHYIESSALPHRISDCSVVNCAPRIGSKVRMLGGFTATVMANFPATEHRAWMVTRIRYIGTGNTETVPTTSLNY